MPTPIIMILIGLVVACEIGTILVFWHQRTIRKLAARLKVAQSMLDFCYPPWMLVVYWVAFSKYVIALVLLFLDWRYACVAIGLFLLFFVLSIIIPTPDGANLIRIRREVKRRGSGTVGFGNYNLLMAEIEKGIVATGGKLENIDAEKKKISVEWNKHFERSESMEWTGYKAKKFTKPNPHDTTERTWKNAPASIKGAIVIIGLVFAGMSLLFGITDGGITLPLVFVLLFILSWLVFWAYQILKGRNWTRVFAMVGVILTLISLLGNVSSDDFDGSSVVGGISFPLVIAALLFCPGANKWFVSWPRGWSYWPVLLVVIQIGGILIKESRMENPLMEHVDDEFTSLNIDYTKAPIKKVLEAARNGIVDAQVNLGLRYATGRGGAEKNLGTSFKWYLMAAEQGDTNAMGQVAMGYGYGSGVKRDVNKAIHWGTILAKNGDDSFLSVYATHLILGEGVPKDATLGIRCYEICAENGDGLAAWLLGSMAEGNNNYVAARKWYGMGAEAGEVGSMLKIGKMYYNGTGGIKNSFQAATWFYKAADKGSEEAMMTLGLLYIVGEGVDKDEEEGVEWIRKAARKGYDPAKELLQNWGQSW